MSSETAAHHTSSQLLQHRPKVKISKRTNPSKGSVVVPSKGGARARSRRHATRRDTKATTGAARRHTAAVRTRLHPRRQVQAATRSPETQLDRHRRLAGSLAGHVTPRNERAPSHRARVGRGHSLDDRHVFLRAQTGHQQQQHTACSIRQRLQRRAPAAAASTATKNEPHISRQGTQ